MKVPILPLFLLLPGGLISAADFQQDIVPILKTECYKCHSEKSGKEKGGFIFDNLKRFSKDIGPGRAIEPGKPDKSDLLLALTLELGDKEHMPPKKQLTLDQITKIKEWIAEGASFEKR